MAQNYIRVNDTLTNILDSATNASVNYEKVTSYFDGTVMDDSKVDGTIYVKLGTEYFRKVNTGTINVKDFKRSGDTDDTLSLQRAFNFAKHLIVQDSVGNSYVMVTYNIVLDKRVEPYIVSDTIEIVGGTHIIGNGNVLKVDPNTTNSIDTLFEQNLHYEENKYNQSNITIRDLIIDGALKANRAFYFIRSEHNYLENMRIVNFNENCVRLADSQFCTFIGVDMENAPIPLYISNNQIDVDAEWPTPTATAYPSLENCFIRCKFAQCSFSAKEGQGYPWIDTPENYPILASVMLDEAASDNNFISCSIDNCKNWGNKATTDVSDQTFIRAGVLIKNANRGSKTANKFIACKSESCWINFMTIGADGVANKNMLYISQHTCTPGKSSVSGGAAIAAVVALTNIVHIDRLYVYHLSTNNGFVADSNGISNPVKYLRSKSNMVVELPTSSPEYNYNGKWIMEIETGEYFDDNFSFINNNPRAYYSGMESGKFVTCGYKPINSDYFLKAGGTITGAVQINAPLTMGSVVGSQTQLRSDGMVGTGENTYVRPDTNQDKSLHIGGFSAGLFSWKNVFFDLSGAFQVNGKDIYYDGHSPAAAISIDSATAVGVAYSQSEVQAILDELRDLKSKMRSANLLKS